MSTALPTRRIALGIPLPAVLPRRLPSVVACRRIAIEEFTSDCGERVAARERDASAEAESLLLELAELGSRLDEASAPRLQLRAFGGLDPQVAFSPLHRSAGFVVFQWKRDPHARLPTHSHTPVDVLSLCLTGECWVEHYEIVGTAPATGAEGEYSRRETHAQLLRPGRASSLTPARDAIHAFQAGPRGALRIDVNIPRPAGGDWSMIEHSPEGEDDFARLHRARWTGKPCASGLQRGLQEPGVLLDGADLAGEQVLAVGVSDLLGQRARGAQPFGVARERGEQPLHQALLVGRRDVGFVQARGPRDLARRAGGQSAERHEALGEFVVARGGLASERLEELVQVGEVEALDVPVRQLELRVQIDAVGEARRERGQEPRARVDRQRADGREQCDLCGTHGVS
jgi:hypothetical protein